MKYRLIDLIKEPQNLTLRRSTNNPNVPYKVVFIRLEPGFLYDKYTDDPVYVQSLRDWTVKLRNSTELERALKERNIPYSKKKGCACTGGVKLEFNGIEVIDE